MRLDEYAGYDGRGLAELVRTRQVSPGELAHAALERADFLANQVCRAVGGFSAASSRGAFGGSICFLAVYVDGALHWSPGMGGNPPDLAKFNPLDLEGMEVYRSAAEIPPEYNATGSACGVILLWTRVQ